eukprot:3095527-Amphidinium_carterae.1
MVGTIGLNYLDLNLTMTDTDITYSSYSKPKNLHAYVPHTSCQVAILILYFLACASQKQPDT